MSTRPQPGVERAVPPRPFRRRAPLAAAVSALFLLALPLRTVAQSGDGPAQEPREWPRAQSTSGPRRPPGQELEAQRAVDRRLMLDTSVVISNVPSYLWYRGCGPTSAGMILGYYDNMGYEGLVDGGATSQTASVNSMIASSGHYEDYSEPLDYYPTLVPDGSQTNVGGCHPSDSVADFMETSWSAAGNYWGWSWSDDVDNALTNYVNWKASQYTCSAQYRTYNLFTWERFCGEIGSNRPVVFLVDTDGNGGSDHFIAIIGYGTDGPTNLYACYDTYDHNIHWYTFGNMAVGRIYGIHSATFFSIEPVSNCPPGKPSNPSPPNGSAGISTNAMLSWAAGWGATGHDVYFGTNPAPGAAEFKGSPPGTVYDPGGLEGGSTYYWRIDASNEWGKATGDVWSFTTFVAHNHYVSRDGGHVFPYTNWATASTSIQEAVNVAATGDWVFVTAGTYQAQAHVAVTSPIVVVSMDGPEATIIDGQDDHRCARVINGVLRGFTLTRGDAGSGEGGGAYVGGYGRIENCRIIGCTADDGGGVAFAFGGTVRNCLVVSNTAKYGGGVAFFGGGLLENCTVGGNDASRNHGGGGFWTDGFARLTNCIVFYNTGAGGANYYENSAGSTYTHCDTTPLLAGTGNIDDVPLFVDYASMDYHLATNSPCRDTGTNQAWMAGDTDLDGSPRIAGGIVDMGAYEYQPPMSGRTLTIASDHGTAILPPGMYTNDVGSVLTNSVTAPSPADGTQYLCAGWSMAGNDPVGGTTNVMTMTHTNNATLTWLWTTNVQFTRDAGPNGAVTGDADGWYALGAGVTVTAVPNDHYHFAGWTGDVPAGQTNSNPLTLAMDCARAVTVLFAADQHTLTVASHDGTADPAPGEHSYDYGTPLDCRVTNNPAQAGTTQFVCTGWVGTGGVADGSGTNVSFTITNDSTLAWTWTTNYWLEVQTNGNGAVSTGNAWFAEGSNVAVVALPAEHWHFAEWMGETNGCVMEGTTNVAPMDAARCVAACFEIDACNVTASSSLHGAISPLSASVGYGGSTSFLMTADGYYHITDVLTNGVSTGDAWGMGTNTYVLSNVTADATVYAVFAENLTTNTGTPEWWLAAHKLTNLPFAEEAILDQDGDGQFAWEEEVADTDPTNTASCFEIRILKCAADGFVTFGSSTARVYTLQRAAQPADGAAWDNVCVRVSGTNVLTTLCDTGIVVRRSLRVRVEKP